MTPPSAARAASRSFTATRRVRRRPLWLVLGAALGGGLALALFAPRAAGHGFDGDRAYEMLKKQVAFGPRVPDTKGHQECAEYLVSTLQPLAGSVERQRFSQTIRGRRLEMENVIARFKGTGHGAGVLLCTHWDTRPTADQETDPRRRAQPIPGANDGASGTAVLLELARVFKQSPPPVPVMLLFIDGEDYGPGEDDMFLGSRYFAAHLPPDTPRQGILLDMIGDQDLQIPKEQFSYTGARDVMDSVYAVAKRLGQEEHFPDRLDGQVEDDHLFFLEKGIRVIDLIDFDYGPGNAWWHTLRDTPDKCSAASLRVVGDVVGEWVYTRG